MNFSSILFDLDGTLVDSLADLQAAVNHALTCFNRPSHAADVVRTFVGDGVRVLMARSLLGKREFPSDSQVEGIVSEAEKLSSPTLDELIDCFREYYTKHLLDNTRTYPGVEEAVAGLAQRGVPLAVVSNKPESYTERILVGLGLRDHFQVVVGGDTVPAKKPDPRPLLYALERMNCHPQEALMVGDSAIDIFAGKRAGCETGVVTHGFTPLSALQEHRPGRVLDDLRHLLVA